MVFPHMIRLLESSLVLTHTHSSNASGKWIESLAASRGQVIAIDGKTLRQSFDRNAGQTGIHLLSAWAGCRLVLGQVKSITSPEITAIPELLKLLEITGCIITIDAMGTQKAIAASIIDQKADYILALAIRETCTKPSSNGLSKPGRSSLRA